MAYIYKITNLINGKIYIGKRVRETKKDIKNYYGSGIAIKNAIIKYGIENFKKEILEHIETKYNCKELCDREKYWIAFYHSNDKNIGYNLTIGGDGGCNQEIAKKIAKARKERGYHHSEETKRKLSNSHRGQKFSELHKKHLSERHHLRKYHIIINKSGKIEKTKDTINDIAKKLGISAIQLRRASSLGEFKYGAYLLDIQRFDLTYFNRHKSEKIMLNPISKVLQTANGYRVWKRHHPEYTNLPLHPFSEEYLKGCNDFINDMTNLLSDCLKEV